MNERVLKCQGIKTFTHSLIHPFTHLGVGLPPILQEAGWPPNARKYAPVRPHTQQTNVGW